MTKRSPRFSFGLSIIALLLGCTAGQQHRQPIELLIGLDADGTCIVRVDGQKISDNDLLQKLTARPAGQEVVVKGGKTNVPYRCVGSTIYTMQRAGVPLKTGLIHDSSE
jgi:biopolymer transport protein ExbD